MDTAGKSPLYAIASETLVDDFPPVETALPEPDGLLAAGGDLNTRRLLGAYRRGIFPWYNEGTPILWWSPDPRCVLFPDDLRVTRSLRKTIRSGRFTVSLDTEFTGVIDGCAAPRKNTDGTWITSDIRQAYLELHRLGHAHCIECWQDGALAGGLYGVTIGRVFFGESMFATVRDASKTAFFQLVRTLQQWGYELIDCQVHTPHLESLGAVNIPRSDFIRHLDKWCELKTTEPDAWPAETDWHE